MRERAIIDLRVATGAPRDEMVDAGIVDSVRRWDYPHSARHSCAVCRIRIVPRALLRLHEGMTDTLDELGPVDYIVVEFPGNKFNGEIAPALHDLIDRKIVKVLDLVFITKDADGTIEGLELSDLDPGVAGEIEKLEIEIAHLLSEDDVVNIAAALEPNSTAAVLVWENRGPRRSRRRSGTQAASSSRADAFRSRR